MSHDVPVRTGLSRLGAGECDHLRGLSLGLVQHPASVTEALISAADVVQAAGLRLSALFGPQHGAQGEKQDNMVESAHATDARTGLPVHSLYSEVRKPTAEMLSGLDVLLFDLQDVGVRVYTFVWTMVLAMEACAKAGVRFIVLDRPNPIGGVLTEGPVLRKGYASFVGLHPIPLRHAHTVGELARCLNDEARIGCDLEVIGCRGWRRAMTWEDTGLPYVLPSPNLPTPDSCAVYPGMVLLEGTNLSEGRGTTRPFEIFGAPYLDARSVAGALDDVGLPGVRFRPCTFEPTFHKHAGRACGGAQLHVTDRTAYRPVRTAVSALRVVARLAPNDFSWRAPPYEYEEHKLPIDILWGHDGLRAGIEAGADPEEILAGTREECAAFERRATPYRLYE